LEQLKSNKDKLRVVFEDNHIIAINKRCGDIIQGDKTGDKPLSEIVKSYLKEKYSKKGNVFLGVTHRLDRPVSGIVLFAKTSKALSRLNKMFKNGEMQKFYLAITENKPNKSEGKLIHWLKKNQKKNKSTYFQKESKGSKRAILHYKLIKKLEKYYLFRIKPETGRHHQIRCQLKAIGCPIRGDLKYGAQRSINGGGIDLHAKKIIFKHPISKEILKLEAAVNNNRIWNSIK
tara:strand:- start:2340 stop:3035 length:696 start_codon:yes stop_codon:yes gene_type:complete